MAKPAYLWIRDGVLIDRMPLNAVAFASVMHRCLSNEQQDSTSVESLINFAFASSGISCADKTKRYNCERKPVPPIDVDSVVEHYNDMSIDLGPRCSYFPGMVDLLRDLATSGANFITSAISQPTLDVWSKSEQGLQIAPYITEFLGSRENFLKGENHFRYVRELGHEPIYLIADAISEIATGRTFSAQYSIVPIGFANVISESNVANAFKMTGMTESPLKVGELELPENDELIDSLTRAGAQAVITGSASEIVSNLRRKLTEIKG